jgi:3-hydroxyisobutyrate dehydrogenase-like beta-hydroxyacid dehydrogenase
LLFVETMTKDARMTIPRIGFAGLGIMGRGMARNFLTKGYPLTVWNRTRAAASALEAEGAEVAPSPRELGARSDVLITSLSTPDAVEAVALGPDGFLSGARRGTCWIDTSTVGSVASLRFAEAAAAAGARYLEAPVTGSKNGARDGTLLVMAGGERGVFEECRSTLDVFASRSIYVGPLGSASVMKLIGNTIISFMLEGLAEGAVLGEKAGVSLETILEVVQASGFASPYWSFKGGAMVRRDFETHFSIDLLHKDQALALAEGAARRVPLPGLAAIHQVTGIVRALGFGNEDIAAQVKAVEAAAGARTPSSPVKNR